MSVTALIPAYNERETIGSVIKETSKYVDQIIVCDDGSYDETSEIIMNSRVEFVQHDRNMGYGASLQSLFNRAGKLGCVIAVTIDADGQHNPKYIPRLIEPIKADKADLVIGARFLEGEESQAPWAKELGVKIINLIIGLGSGLKISDSQSGYRAYKIRALNGLEIQENGMGASTEIILKAVKKGIRIVEVPVQVTHYDKVCLWRFLMHGFSVVFSTLRYLV